VYNVIIHCFQSEFVNPGGIGGISVCKFQDSCVIHLLAAINFRDRAFFIQLELHNTPGSRREIFAMLRFSRTSQNFLARE
jgi:hypothetical protein